MTLPPIPEATLRSTYIRLRQDRPHWPDTYERAMADPIIARVVDMMARHSVPTFGRRSADRARIGLRPAGQHQQRQPELEAADDCRCPSGVCEGMIVRQGEHRTCKISGTTFALPDGAERVRVAPMARPLVTKRQPGIDFKSRAAGEREEPDSEPPTIPMPLR